MDESEQKYLEDPHSLYPHTYYANRVGKIKHQRVFGKILSKFLDKNSVVDFGCGLGSYLLGALDGGSKEVLGFDLGADIGREFIPEKVSPFIKYGHIGKPIDCAKHFCAMSIEAAEHIAPEQTDTFVDNITNAAKRVIVFTAASNRSTLHINPWNKYYWANKFYLRGWKYDRRKSNTLREMWLRAGLKHYTHLYNVMVFTRIRGNHQVSKLSELIHKSEGRVQRVAEIGVAAGATTKKILEFHHDDISQYWAIDPWVQFVQSPKRIRSKEWWDKCYWDMCELMWQFTKLRVLRMTSIDAAKLFPKEYFDLVFIDADHSYNCVKENIKEWLPLVRKGGWLTGHDYDHEGGVKQAVDEAFPKDEIEIISVSHMWVKEV